MPVNTRSAVDGSIVSFPLPTRQTAGMPGPDIARPAPPLRPSGTVTGYDGSELVTIRLHDEPVRTRAGDQAQLVVDVSGEIDADTAPLLHAALADAIGRRRHVCCDLTGVDFLAAAGANTIMAARRYADETGCAFTVRGVHGIAARVFHITGLDTVDTPPV